MPRGEAIRQTLDYAKRNGLAATYAAVRERLQDRHTPYLYQAPAQEELEAQRRESAEAIREGRAPRISVVVPCHHTPKRYLDALQASLEAQTYDNYELILTREPGGISANTNAGIEQAKGDYIALLDHDDVLAPDALYHMAKAVMDAHAKGIEPLLVYSDEDKLTVGEDGGERYYAPNVKPDFNYDYLLSNNYICHFSMVEAGTMKRLKLRSAFDGAQDHDLFLRITQEAAEGAGGDYTAADARIVHVPRILYHWRAAETSTAASGANKSYAHEAGGRAVRDHLMRRGINCAVEETAHRGFFRVHYFDGVFQARGDVAAIGGKLVDRRGRMVGGLYTDDGEILFEGLPRGFSGGFTHRAACQQDAEAVDLMNMILRPELEKALPGELKGFLKPGTAVHMDRDERVRASVQLCRAIRGMGYRILWDPQQIRMIGTKDADR